MSRLLPEGSRLLPEKRQRNIFLLQNPESILHNRFPDLRRRSSPIHQSVPDLERRSGNAPSQAVSFEDPVKFFCREIPGHPGDPDMIEGNRECRIVKHRMIPAGGKVPVLFSRIGRTLLHAEVPYPVDLQFRITKPVDPYELPDQALLPVGKAVPADPGKIEIGVSPARQGQYFAHICNPRRPF